MLGRLVIFTGIDVVAGCAYIWAYLHRRELPYERITVMSEVYCFEIVVSLLVVMLIPALLSNYFSRRPSATPMSDEYKVTPLFLFIIALLLMFFLIASIAYREYGDAVILGVLFYNRASVFLFDHTESKRAKITRVAASMVFMLGIPLSLLWSGNMGGEDAAGLRMRQEALLPVLAGYFIFHALWDGIRMLVKACALDRPEGKLYS